MGSSRPTEVMSSLDHALEEERRARDERGLERSLRPVWGRSGAEVRTAHGDAIDFASNDYLGLASDPRLGLAASDALARCGVGSAASRLITGDHPEHETLERELAAFFDADAALLFSTGYAANVGTIPALVGRGDVIFADAANHASLIDGCRLSRATVHVYSHGAIGLLEQLLDRERGAHRRALIVTDGLFSMDGDLAPLGEIAALARRYDAWSYVDDAHAAGVLGDHGRGSLEALGVAGEIDIVVGTLGKAFGTAGAFVYGSEPLRHHLLNHARSFIYSTAMLAAQAAAAREAVRMVAVEPERRARLRTNAAHLRAALEAVMRQSIAGSTAHIIPMVIGAADETTRIASALRERGFLVGAVRPPTVPEGTSRFRITVSAAHTARQIDDFATALTSLLPR